MEPLVQYDPKNVIETIPLVLASPRQVANAVSQAGHSAAHKLMAEGVANALLHGRAEEVVLSMDRETRRVVIGEIAGRGMPSDEVRDRFWHMFDEFDRTGSLGPKWDAGIKQALRQMEFAMVTTRTPNERLGRRYVVDFQSEDFNLLLMDTSIEHSPGTEVSVVMRPSDPFPRLEEAGTWLANIMHSDLLSRITIESREDGKLVRKNALMFLPKQGAGKAFSLPSGLNGTLYFEPSAEGRLRVISRALVYEMPLSSILRETQVGSKSVDLLDPDGKLFGCVPLEKHSGQGLRDVEPWVTIGRELKTEVLKLDAERKEDQQKRETEAFDKQVQELERRALKAFEALDIDDFIALYGRGRATKTKRGKRKPSKNSRVPPKDSRRRGSLINFGKKPEKDLLGWTQPVDTRNPDGLQTLWFNENFLPYEKLRQGKKDSSVRTRQARLVYVAQFLAQLAAGFKLRKEKLEDTGENRMRIVNKFQKEFAVDFEYDEGTGDG